MEFIQNNGDYINSNIILVNGDAGVNSYPVARGNQVVLFDQYTNRFWIKAVDINGRSALLRECEYTERVIEPEIPSDPKVIGALSKITEQIEMVMNRLDSLEQRQPQKQYYKKHNQEKSEDV